MSISDIFKNAINSQSQKKDISSDNDEKESGHYSNPNLDIPNESVKAHAICNNLQKYSPINNNNICKINIEKFSFIEYRKIDEEEETEEEEKSNKKQGNISKIKMGTG